MIHVITNKTKYMEICQHDERLSENRTLNNSYQLAQVLIPVFLELRRHLLEDKSQVFSCIRLVVKQRDETIFKV